MHFYCDTYDITRPFPSSHPVSDYHNEFCWNDALALTFEQVGLRAWCIVLLQGMASSRSHSYHQSSELSKSVSAESDTSHHQNNISLNSSAPNLNFSTGKSLLPQTSLKDVVAGVAAATMSTPPLPRHNYDDGNPEKFTICVITRKSRYNPGTRYTARGLNEDGGPGNECECEFIMWKFTPKPEAKNKLTNGTVEWCSFVWRRGTVPLWWQTTLKSSVCYSLSHFTIYFTETVIFEGERT